MRTALPDARYVIVLCAKETMIHSTEDKQSEGGLGVDTLLENIAMGDKAMISRNLQKILL